MIRHIVLMKCKSEVSQQEINDVLAALEALKNTIPGILAVDTGENNSPEGINRGYTHGFTMDFADEQARETYLPHPEHKKVQAKMQKILDKSADCVLVFDFPVKEDVYRSSYK